MVLSEYSRVKIPCILYLVRLGYRYLSLNDAAWDEATNINRFIEITDRLLLQDVGKVTAEIAKAHTESEFEK